MTTRCTAALALLMFGGVLGSAYSASADFTIRVDNESNPGAFGPWAAPNGKVRIEVGMVTLNTLRQLVPNAIEISETHDAKFLNEDWANIESVCIINDSDDMFGLDQLEILDSRGRVKKTYAWDDQQAWCLSQDPDDGMSDDCNNQQTRSTMCFYPKTE